MKKAKKEKIQTSHPMNGRFAEPGEPTNRERADWAQASLDTFCRETGQSTKDPGDFGDAVADLICDLMHLAAFSGPRNPNDILRSAVSNFEHESA